MAQAEIQATNSPVGSCYLPGNIIFSCQKDIPKSEFVKQPQSDYMKGYDQKPVHPMYKTTTQDYGSQTPTIHSMPNVFHCKSQKFSNHLGVCGMYRNQSLNTHLEQPKV